MAEPMTSQWDPGLRWLPKFDIEDPVLAAIAWARIVEPADPVAGELVAALGPCAALALLRHPDGPRARHELGAERGSPRSEALWTRWLTVVKRWWPRLDSLAPQRELAVLHRFGGTLIHPGDPRWPVALDDLGAARPFCLWVRGDPAVVTRAPEGGIAVVGARANTDYGELAAGELVAALAADRRVIVSGGAYGIDAVAHRVALSVGGETLAVMAGGLDRFYPAGNSDLLERVAREGAVVSEVGPGSAPSRTRFLTRNRLIAALSSVCVVVEAGSRSGTLSTANHAIALLRPVAAVPGPVTSAASRGCHELIRDQKAVLVHEADHVRALASPLGAVDELLVVPGRHSDVGFPPGSAERLVWDALPARGWAEVDSLARVAAADPRVVRTALGRLELADHVERDGDRYRRRRQP